MDLKKSILYHTVEHKQNFYIAGRSSLAIRSLHLFPCVLFAVLFCWLTTTRGSRHYQYKRCSPGESALYWWGGGYISHSKADNTNSTCLVRQPRRNRQQHWRPGPLALTSEFLPRCARRRDCKRRPRRVSIPRSLGGSASADQREQDSSERGDGVDS